MNYEQRTMNYEQRTTNSEPGFSLSEVLMAVGILAVGLMFIAGTFPVGIGLTTTAAERTIAAVVADEAFAKIKLYGVSLSTDSVQDFNEVALTRPIPAEFTYPSIDTDLPRQYRWSALCRRIDLEQRLVQVTVFVSRKTNPGLMYPDPPVVPEDIPLLGTHDRPVPVLLPGGGHFTRTGEAMLRTFLLDFQYDLMGVISNFIKPGTTIMDDATGQLYQVQKITEESDDLILVLDGPGQPGGDSDKVKVWVVPRPAGGGRFPCIGIYQRIIKF